MGDLATWCLVISRNTRQTGSLVRGNLAQDYVDTADNDRQVQAAHRRCSGAVRSRTVVELASGKGRE